ncbi:DNA topoisomerase IB [Nocardia sp. CA-119907]|uniref:DNA topoisomerase IB n=1 Tax=Nocardia sp. CA-119907 TaxID=3239973 RepID=UPI003D964F5C
MPLRRSRPYGPGIRRTARGRGFSYITSEGERVLDGELLERIRGLVIPPAWRRVWICPYANGHIQAIGVDSAGRRQYIYHEQWRRERDEEKFDRVLELATRLPELRERIRDDLDRSGLTRHRVEAVAVGLIDRGVFRIGGEEYAAENGTRGIATLLRDQVQVDGDEMLFDYVAKGGARRCVRIRDAPLARAVRALRRSRADSGRLLVYRQDGRYRDLHADDINACFKELTGIDCSAKDLRTWQATVIAAAEFGRMDPPTSRRAQKNAERAVVAEVAAALGNTPAVARASYIDPRVVECFADGVSIARALVRARRAESDDEVQLVIERAVIRMLRRAGW